MLHIYRKNIIPEEGLKSLLPHFALTDEQEEAEGILVRSADTYEERLGATALTIARVGASINSIPLERFAEKGVIVFNIPGANTNSVEELVLHDLSLVACNTLLAVGWLREKQDETDITKAAGQGKKQFVGAEIRGKKFDVIGLGAIGMGVADTAVVLDMEVYDHDPYLSVNGARGTTKEARHMISLEELYKQCNCIVTYVPPTGKNPGMIGEKGIAAAKERVIFLDFPHDELVDKQAMGRALENDKMRLYVIDFANPFFITPPQAIVTPYLGTSTEEAEDHCAVMAVKELMSYFDNGSIRNSTNYPNCDVGIPVGMQCIALLHENVPNMTGQISSMLAEQNINIDNVASKSRDAYTCMLLNLETRLMAEGKAALKAVPGVIHFCVVTGGRYGRGQGVLHPSSEQEAGGGSYGSPL